MAWDARAHDERWCAESRWASAAGIHDYHATDLRSCVLLRFYRTGADLQTKLPLLATHMGHISIASSGILLIISYPDLARGTASDRFCARYTGPSLCRNCLREIIMRSIAPQ